MASHVGGYDEDRGWDPDAKDRVDPVVVDKAVQYISRLCWKSDGNGWSSGERSVRGVPLDEHADASEDDESLSITKGWQTIASHGMQVGREVERIADQVAPTLVKLLHLAGRWHDLGKAHRAFQGSIQSESRPSRNDIAKARISRGRVPQATCTASTPLNPAGTGGAPCLDRIQGTNFGECPRAT